MAAAVDVLVVDEAGQISLANVLAASGAAESVVLLGDPRQLEQPQKGVHPPGTDVAALQHLVGIYTLGRDRGLFLEETWRLHPDLKPIRPQDILVLAPYHAQVTALRAACPRACPSARWTSSRVRRPRSSSTPPRHRPPRTRPEG
jgi:hypothetical protein